MRSRPLGLLGKSDTVGITFQGRLFVWHHIDDEHDPVVSAVLEQDVPAEWKAAAAVAQRLLSAVVYDAEHVPVISPSRGGGTPTTNPWAPATVRVPRSAFGLHLNTAPASIEVANDSHLRLALALYREAVNAASPFYEFLALWNALGAAIQNEAQRTRFINTRGPAEWRLYANGDRLPRDLHHEFYEASRNAIAHAVRDRPSKTVIDPDLPTDRQRLERNSRVLRPLVHTAITASWPQGLRVERH